MIGFRPDKEPFAQISLQEVQPMSSTSKPENGAFSYRLLGKNDIRLLQICATRRESDPIVCELEHVSLEDHPPYEALSYTWGSRENSGFIEVDGRAFEIRENALAALRCLRSQKRPVVLWVDAICINQNDITEKATQIPLMTRIYEQASQVNIWLGESQCDSDVGMTMLQDHLLKPKQFTRFVANSWKHRKAGPAYSSMFNSSWAVLGEEKQALEWEFISGEQREIFSRPWWSRVWTMQEAIVGQQLYLYCGKERVAWNRLKERMVDPSNVELSYSSKNLHVTGPFGLPDVLTFDVCDANTNLITEYRALYRQGKLRRNMCNMLYRFRDHNCFDPRDRIFGFLGLADASLLQRFAPDYTESASQTYCNFAKAFIDHRRGSLDILNYRREWKNAPPPISHTYAYRPPDQARYHDIQAKVVDRPGRKSRRGWAKLPEGWERHEEGRNAIYLDWNSKQAFTDSPLETHVPAPTRSIHDRRLCPQGWSKDWDNLGRSALTCVQPHSPRPNEQEHIICVPSWVPNWHSRSAIDAAPLLGSARGSQYCAGGMRFPDGVKMNPSNSLTVHGILFDEIESLAAPWHPESDAPPLLRASNDVLRFWEAVALAEPSRCPYRNRETRSEALWRTYIGASADDMPNIREWSLYSCWRDLTAWVKTQVTPDTTAGRSWFDSVDLEDEYRQGTEKTMHSLFHLTYGGIRSRQMKGGATIFPPTGSREEILRDYGALLQRIQHVCAHRALFVTAKGYMGLAPWSARQGDTVAVLMGARTPFILRKRSDADAFSLIEECYVAGIMAGEAMEHGEIRGIELV